MCKLTLLPLNAFLKLITITKIKLSTCGIVQHLPAVPRKQLALCHKISLLYFRISNRAQENRKKLDELKRRIDVAEAKINHVKGSNRAIQVFSCSKYPAPNQLQNYVSVFHGKFKIILLQ